MLRLAIIAEIAITATVTGVLTFAWNQPVQLPHLWNEIYQSIVKSMTYAPVAAFLALLFWIYRANKNAAALSGRALENGPGWAVGWFFVPIAGWWKPYEVMRELYKASRTPHDWRNAKGASIIGWWWGIRLISTLGGLALTVAHPAGQSLIRLTLGLVAAMLADQILLMLITTRIDKWQAKAHRTGGVEAVF